MKTRSPGGMSRIGMRVDSNRCTAFTASGKVVTTRDEKEADVFAGDAVAVDAVAVEVRAVECVRAEGVVVEGVVMEAVAVDIAAETFGLESEAAATADATKVGVGDDVTLDDRR